MNTLFLIALIVESIFGLGFIFAPDVLLNPMGVILNESAANPSVKMSACSPKIIFQKTIGLWNDYHSELMPS